MPSENDKVIDYRTWTRVKR